MKQALPFYRRIGCLVELGILASVVVALSMLWNSLGCPYDKFGNSPHLRIGGSPWIVDIWGQGCGFGLSGGMEIRAFNERTQATITVVELVEVTTDVSVSSDQPQSLVVTLPDEAEVVFRAAEFSGVTVSYRFTPYDDPEARRLYRKWTYHPLDPEARNWWCENILARMDQANGEQVNRSLTKDHRASLASGESYCPTR